MMLGRMRSLARLGVALSAVWGRSGEAVDVAVDVDMVGDLAMVVGEEKLGVTEVVVEELLGTAVEGDLGVIVEG